MSCSGAIEMGMPQVGAGGHRSVANARRQLDRRAGLVDAEAPTSEHAFVDAGVKTDESIAELDFDTVDGNRAMRGTDAGLPRKRQVLRLRRQEPDDAGALQFQRAGHAPRLAKVHGAS